MNFDNAGGRRYAPLVLLPGGLVELGGGNSKDRRAKRRKATANDDASGNNPPTPKAGTISNNDHAPATIREARAWLRYFGIPERFHRFILPIVALVAVLIVLQVASGGIGPPLRWAYLRLPVVSDLKRLENQINDKKTGLPALTENESKSRLQLEYVMGFLAGRFPEFSSQALKDAQSAAQKGDIPDAVQLLKTATTAVRNLKAQKIEAPASFFSNAIDILSKIGSTPASASTGPEMHDTREALVDYKSALERDTLPLPHGRPINNPPIEIAHLTIEGGSSAILNLFPPARSVDQLTKVTDVRLVGAGRQAVASPFTQQALDNFNWTNVTFVHIFVVYGGGLVVLKNVKFTDCTFLFAHNPNASKVLDSIALELPLVEIKNSAY